MTRERTGDMSSEYFSVSHFRIQRPESMQRGGYLHGDMSPAMGEVFSVANNWKWTWQVAIISLVHSGEEHTDPLGFFSVPKSPSCSNLEVPGQSEQGGGIVFPGGGSLSFTVLWSEGDSMVLIQDSPWDLGACSLPFLQRGRALRRRCLLLNVKSLGHW